MIVRRGDVHSIDDLDDSGYDGGENKYRALGCGSCLCYVWPNMQAAYMDSWLAWLA
jgi:hypothetical protein